MYGDNLEYCSTDCPLHPDAYTLDEKMKVTHQYDQKEIMTTLKLYGILSSSLLLVGLLVIGLGI